MNTNKIFKPFLFFVLLAIPLAGWPQQKTAKEIVAEAEDQWQGEKSSISQMTMKIIRPTWERTIEMKNWIKGRDYALTLITAPSNEAGQTFLKRDNEMWHWMPSIGRLIKMPPSMMSQGWMGSDYTNDDILKESSMVTDYQHTLIGEEEVNGKKCYKIRMVPHQDAAVVWGKVIKWISKAHFNQLKSAYYDEDGELVRTELLSEVKEMDGRMVPTHIQVIPAEEKDKKTVLELNDIRFNRDISDGFFSQQNMKRVRP